MHFRLAEKKIDFSGNLLQAMDRAISAMMPKDHPFGISLSGGIDSGLILAWCLKNGYKPQLFSVRFPAGSSGAGDTAAVEEMAGRFGLDITWVESNPEDFDAITKCSKTSDVLVADSALILTQKIARAAKEKGVHILFSGAGADEWFGGYRRHDFFRRWLSVFNDRISNRIVGNLLHTFKPGKLAWMKHDLESVEGLWQCAVSSRLNSSLASLSLLPLRDESESRLESMLAWDQQYFLSYDVLSISDLAGMAEGVEMRFPFLHPAMTAFAASLPLQLRMGSGRKEMLRDEFRKTFGNMLADRQKQGFGIVGSGLLRDEQGFQKMEFWLCQIENNLPDLLNLESWQNFRQKAMAQPEEFLQEWITLGRLSSWLLLQHQKPAVGAAFPETP